MGLTEFALLRVSEREQRRQQGEVYRARPHVSGRAARAGWGPARRGLPAAGYRPSRPAARMLRLRPRTDALELPAFDEFGFLF